MEQRVRVYARRRALIRGALAARAAVAVDAEKAAL
jgi:hypothetical protein